MLIVESKTCSKCSEVLDLSNFSRQPSNRDGLEGRCKTCMSKYARVQHLKKHFGLSMGDYAAMLEDQGGGCAICGGVDNRRLCVDHNHSTGQIRALLCTGCNSALHVLENHDLCNKLAGYLERYE